MSSGVGAVKESTCRNFYSILMMSVNSALLHNHPLSELGVYKGRHNKKTHILPLNQDEIPRLVTLYQNEIPRLVTLYQNEIPRLVTLYQNEIPRLVTLYQNEIPRLLTLYQNEIPRLVT